MLLERVAGVALVTYVLWVVLHRKRKKAKAEYQSPLVQGLNREKAHSMLAGFLTQNEARLHVMQFLSSPFTINLNGKWEFSLFRSPEQAMKAMETHSQIQTSNIKVPGHWQLQGQDFPVYTNIKYPYKVDPPIVPEENPTGYYRCMFQVDASWSSRQVYLAFLGVDSASYVWLNGKFVGFSKDSRLTAEYNITEHMNFNGKNVLEVIVLRYCDGSYLEDQDMWNVSGIFRTVYLYSLPRPVRIRDYNWRSTMENVMPVGTLNVDVVVEWDVGELTRGISTVDDAREHSRDWLVCLSLYEEGVMVSTSVTTDGTTVYHFDSSSEHPIEQGKVWVPVPQPSVEDLQTGRISVSVTASLKVTSPKQWSADWPYLYTLVTSLRDGYDDIILQAESCRVGFRTIELHKGLLRINGRPVIIRGVNVHEHHPVEGHTVSAATAEADVRLLKQNNFNAVRCSHYPHQPWFYELCNMYGLFVVDEANIETHGMKPYAGYLSDHPDWETAYLERLKRMYARDKTHPCILIWSLGNESGYGKHHDVMAAWLERKDDTRLVMYEPASYGPRSNAAGNGGSYMATHILCPMYARVADCVRLANQFPDFPLVQCEYSHAMGNSNGGLSVYWKAFRQYPRLQGGFIWDWVDQGFLQYDACDRKYWAYGGDFGEAITDATFCCNGLNWPDRSRGGKPALLEAKDCMKCFRCSISSVDITIDRPGGVVVETNVVGLDLHDVDINHHISESDSDESVDEWEDDGEAEDTLVAGNQVSMSVLDTEEVISPPESPSKAAKVEGGVVSSVFASPLRVSRASSDSALPVFGRATMDSLTRKSEIGKESNSAQKRRRKKRSSLIAGVEITELESTVRDDGGATKKTVTRTQAMRDRLDKPATFWQKLGHAHPDSLSPGRPKSTRLMKTKLLSSCTGHMKRYLSLRLTLLNDFDHLDDLTDLYVFDVTLLCDGVIVGRVGVEVVANGIRHDHNSSDELARPSVQELEGIAVFKLLFRKGDPFNESNGLEQFTFNQLQPETVWIRGRSWSWNSKCFARNGRPLNNRFNAQVTPSSEWTAVVTMRLASHTAWAAAGHELGHTQLSLRRFMGQLFQGPTSLDVSASVATLDNNETSSLFFSIPIPLRRTWSRDSEQLSRSLRAPVLSIAHSLTGRTVGSLSVESLTNLDSNATRSRRSTHSQEQAEEASNIGVGLVPSNLVSVRSLSTDAGIVISCLHRGSYREVVINPTTGMLEGLQLDGYNFLADSKTHPEYRGACRLLLHRAATDNDKGGYLFQWESAGMDRSLDYVARHKYTCTTGNPGSDICSERWESLAVVTTAIANTDGRGVMCQWRMAPHKEDRALLRLLKRLQKFQDNTRGLVEVFSDLSAREEAFVHRVAAAYILGHESVACKDTNHRAVVRVWKPSTPLCSTIPLAEGLSVAPQRAYDGEEEVEADEDSSSLGPEHFVDVTVSYVLTPEGDLHIFGSVDTSSLPVTVPRIGLQMFINQELQFVRYYGKGPHENYPDRGSSCLLALHETNARHLFVPYVCPSENGCRCDVRWMQMLTSPSLEVEVEAGATDRVLINDVSKPGVTEELSRKAAARHRLSVTSSSPFAFSYQRYTTEDLSRANHIRDLYPRQLWSLSLDSRVMGVGGDDSWTACVHEEHLLPPQEYQMQYTLSMHRSL